ncbi:MAG TPA: saccharopine dehydrogenase, partial [Microbacterium sp.]|nr:saccharopine dehydrogenase [Microbacterium sp.]
MNQRILVYGATGYTGKLVAAEADACGLDVVLAGRDAETLKAVAEPFAFETRTLLLEDGPRLRAALEDFSVVLHIAGPFSTTARPMVDACLATGTHYLDVTGEIDVFEAIARRDAEARAAGVLLLPGVGASVVPSDCLAVHTTSRVEEPTHLRIAIAGMGGGVSRGTARTLVESLGDGLRIRRDGILQRQASGSLERRFDFGAGPTRGIAMPWGDVATAFHSTGIPNIEVYFILSGGVPRMIKASRLATPLLRTPALQRFLKRRIDGMREGPTAAEREGTRTFLLAEVEGAGGETARSLLETPSGYALTPIVAVEAA